VRHPAGEPGGVLPRGGHQQRLTASELGLSYLLPRAIGSSRAAELMLTGRDLGADEAERIGLVSRLVEPEVLVEEAVELGSRIAAFSRPGVELTKRSLWSSLDAGSLESHLQLEGLGQLYVRLLTANFEEATLARKEGRVPRFTDER
jgi:enoyl-CoA hydratase